MKGKSIMMIKKMIASTLAALTLCTGALGALNASAYDDADSHSKFSCYRTVYDGYVSIQNLEDVARWGSVSMIAYNANGGIMGSDGYDKSLSQNAICDQRTTFSGNFYSLRCSACLFYGNNPQGTPLSYYNVTLY